MAERSYQEFVLKRDDGKYFMFANLTDAEREYEIGDVTSDINEAKRCVDTSALLEMLPDKQRWKPVPVRVTVEEIN